MFSRVRSALFGTVDPPPIPKNGETAKGPLPLKFPYSRPNFLQLITDDEVQVSADHDIRPIMVPRDITKLPWNSGYAEAINAGKSVRNEDQGAVLRGVLYPCANKNSTEDFPDRSVLLPQNASVLSPKTLESSIINAEKAHEAKNVKADESAVSTVNREPQANENPSTEVKFETQSKDQGAASYSGNAIDACEIENGEEADESVGIAVNCKPQENKNPSIEMKFTTPPSSPEKKMQAVGNQTIPWVYFALFDGHAGSGVAVSAANTLHKIIQEKLQDVSDLLLLPEKDLQICVGKKVTVDSLIVGAFESAFWEMDNLIAKDKKCYTMTGGCTAVVAVFILGKLYVCNAGDSRAVQYKGTNVMPMSFDFTPETEARRLRKLGLLRPELLGGEFTYLEFVRQPERKDLGKKILHRDAYMTGWCYKSITMDDLKFPLVYREGKRSRLLATIGVTRGFGDHDLKAMNTDIAIKPFLTAEPEVRILDLTTKDLTDSDVLVMGTDGLWDVTSNEKTAEIVQKSLDHFPANDTHRYKYRYTSAAQDLVMASRGKLQEGRWRTSDNKSATVDDISVFVIPLRPYKEEHLQWLSFLDVEKPNSDENTAKVS